MIRRVLLLCLLLVALSAHATVYDLGTIGLTYGIAEPDLLQSFQARLERAEANGELATVEKELKARYAAYAQRPQGISLPRAQASRHHYFDPAVRFSEAITDHEGKELWPAGTVVNPLDYITLSQQWLFFDGDDPEQAQWAHDYIERNPGRVRPILTRGAVVKLMEQWQRRLYFDQGGRYCQRLGVKALPSLVTQEGKMLRIDEIVVENRVGDGHG